MAKVLSSDECLFFLCGCDCGCGWLVGFKTEFFKVTFSLFWENSKGKNGFGTGEGKFGV